MTIKTRTLVALLLSSAFTMTAKAQETNATTGTLGNSQIRFDESAPQRIMPTRYGGRLRKLQETEEPSYELQPAHDDSLHLPTLSATTASPINRYPFGWCSGFNSWALHRGLNVQVGASVFAEFGKGAHRGAGFQENIALMYAMPVTDKLSVAVGGYFNNINYAGNNWREAGLSAVLGYQFNEHWEAYIYAQKSITNNISNRLRYGLYDGYYGGYGMGPFSRSAFGLSPYSMYDIGNFGDRIGATVRYNFVQSRARKLRNYYDGELAALNDRANNLRQEAESEKARADREAALRQKAEQQNSDLQRQLDDCQKSKKAVAATQEHFVQFDHNSSYMSREEMDRLRTFARSVKGEKLSILAEASTPGIQEYNQTLSERRLKRVVKVLLKEGFAPEDLQPQTAIGAKNGKKTFEGRRVTIKVKK